MRQLPVRRAVLAATLAAVLAVPGCGFHLRTWDLAGTFDAVRIDADASVDLDRELAQAFRAANVRVAQADADADIVIRLREQREARRNVSVTAGGLAAEYEMALQISFGVVSDDGEALAGMRELRSERVARLDRDNIVGSSEEQALLAAEMRTDLVGRIVRVLGALSQNAQRAPRAGESADAD